jgi:hypothetical protein
MRAGRACRETWRGQQSCGQCPVTCNIYKFTQPPSAPTLVMEVADLLRCSNKRTRCGLLDPGSPLELARNNRASDIGESIRLKAIRASPSTSLSGPRWCAFFPTLPKTRAMATRLSGGRRRRPLECFRVIGFVAVEIPASGLPLGAARALSVGIRKRAVIHLQLGRVRP